MEQSQIHLDEAADPNRMRLLETAKAMVLKGELSDKCKSLFTPLHP